MFYQNKNIFTDIIFMSPKKQITILIHKFVLGLSHLFFSVSII
jgi:hypothetical protein